MTELTYRGHWSDPRFDKFISQFVEEDKSLIKEFLSTATVILKSSRVHYLIPAGIVEVTGTSYGSSLKLEAIRFVKGEDTDQQEVVCTYTREHGTILSRPIYGGFAEWEVDTILAARKLRRFGTVYIEGKEYSEDLVKQLWEELKDRIEKGRKNMIKDLSDRNAINQLRQSEERLVEILEKRLFTENYAEFP